MIVCYFFSGLACGGTLFLDEIGNLSPAMQAKLLSVLQNRQLIRVGENSPISIDVRLVCATNGNLLQMVRESRFREDLLYRINTIQIDLPPLRDRKSDIPELARFFVDRYANKYHKKAMRITKEAMAKLKTYSWPGNVRELQHAIEKAVILSDATILDIADFAFRSEDFARVDASGGTLEDMEKQLIQTAMKKQSGNLSAVASQLGITRQTLYNKIRKYGL
ncbi:sigma 54-interacting transcriptional regulator [Ancylomarina longa]|uniref:Sigma-54-dependent Fis family transcriptional regulator n=1 Tax=Ancylomarina longa TaxID=2487017 RepID=A0A434AEJ5_9BACT|nr:sigma 54-interacting transcriptional regulator [Ancylomarina longa]RUT72813.1 sigma-54-dependent Fis family transcriptional regulator [Ancylomarina longa]